MESQQDRKPAEPPEPPRPAEVPPPAPKKRFRFIRLEPRETPRAGGGPPVQGIY